MSTIPVDWSTGTHSGLVSLGPSKYSLYLHGAGPPRAAGNPAVLIVTGLGDEGESWAAVMRMVSPFARIYSYHRANLGKSDKVSGPRTAVVMAEELRNLLHAAGVGPPYVLIAHSYGGIIAREFLALDPSAITGLVLVETLQERTGIERPTPFPEIKALLAKVDFWAVTGVDKKLKLTAEEMDAVAKVAGQGDAGPEFGEAEKSMLVLGEKMQLETKVLGARRVSVVKAMAAREMRLAYDAAIEAGNGTLEQREVVRAFVDGMEVKEVKLQTEQLGLSSEGRFVLAEESGHNVQLTQPSLISEEVRWVMGLGN